MGVGKSSAVTLVTLLIAGCGSTIRDAAPPPARVAAALKGSPAPLAALHAQADQLLSGGAAAFRSRLAGLRGYPVVVNKWASWCGPCQVEFPAFQRAAVDFGRRVAFIGIDGKDQAAAAAAFLGRLAVSYPSYSDPSEQVASELRASTYYPQTVYIDRTGRIVFDHAGPYLSAALLERDIERYLAPGR